MHSKLKKEKNKAWDSDSNKEIKNEVKWILLSAVTEENYRKSVLKNERDIVSKISLLHRRASGRSHIRIRSVNELYWFLQGRKK